MASKFKDSYCLVFHGSRRGGKTLSMVVQAIIDMLSGRKCFSNFPISFTLNGKIYQSEILDYYALLAQDDMYKDSVICWDETAFWLSARNPNAGFNKIATLVLTLIGKWEVNFYSTVQFLNFLDKNVRQQADAIVLCTDLSFKYHQLGRGTHIGQLLQDTSGRFTGTMYDYSHEIFQRTLAGKWAWPCYDTKIAFDIFETQRKVRIDTGKGVILSKNGIDNAITNDRQFTENESRELITLQHIIGEFIEEGKTEVQPWELKNKLRNYGIPVTDYKWRQITPYIDLEVVGNKQNPRFKLPIQERELAYA